jgi:hypothetical protein
MLAGFMPGLALALGVAIGVGAVSKDSPVEGLAEEPTFRGIPVRALGADSGESYALSTGPVDGESEALYALDFLTGDLYAWVYYPRAGQFLAQYQYNVTADLASEAGKTPSYVMVTGQSDIRGPAGQQAFANSILYIADSNTGKVAAYSIPWDRNLAAQAAPQQGAFVRLGLFQGRKAAIRR